MNFYNIFGTLVYILTFEIMSGTSEKTKHEKKNRY